jgi:hypothetical protein
MAAKAAFLQQCDTCERRDCIGVRWRRDHTDGRVAGPVASLCLSCVMEGATALACYGNRQVPPSEKV